MSHHDVSYTVTIPLMDLRDFDANMVRPIGTQKLDEILALVFGSAFAGRGFEHATSRQWVRSVKPEVREVLVLNNGTLVWGFSLDFVPHVSGDRVFWHRTVKSAMLDLRYDPTDYLPADEDINQWQVHSLFGEEHAEATARDVVIKCLPLALQFFDTVTRIEDLPEAFEAHLSRRAVRLGFYNYTQQPLAHLFTLARLGQQERAHELLDRYAERYKLRDWVTEQLREGLTKTMR
jgi:hypothetical protein